MKIFWLFMKKKLASIPELKSPLQGSLWDLVKLALTIDENQRPSSTTILQHPLFQNQEIQFKSKQELEDCFAKFSVEIDKKTVYTTEFNEEVRKNIYGINDSNQNINNYSEEVHRNIYAPMNSDQNKNDIDIYNISSVGNSVDNNLSSIAKESKNESSHYV